MKLKLLAAFLIMALCSGLASQASFAVQDADEDKTEKKGDQQESLQDRMKAAQRLLRSGETEDGLDLLKEIYEDNPENVMIAVNLLNVMQRVALELAQEDRSSGNQYFYESAELARKLLAKDKIPGQAKSLVASCIYNEACTYAIDGKNEKALKSLKESFEAGFDDFELASTDSDFGDLLESDEFKKIITDRKKLLAQQKIDALNKAIADFESYDFDFDLEDVDGKKIKKSDFKGKTLIVDIWGTWCGPCRREIPSFIKLKKAYSDNLDIVGFAYERADDDEEATEKVQEFMEDLDMNYSCALGTKKIKKQIPKFKGYPTTLFIDTDGKVRLQLVGFRTFDDLETSLKAVMEAAAK